MNVTMRELQPGDEPVLRPWFTDPDSEQYAGGEGQLDQALHADEDPYVMQHAYVLCDNGIPVAYVAVEYALGDGWTVVLVVDPARRGEGYGRAALQQLTEQEPFDWETRFTAEIAPDNQASLACFEAAGFTRDEDIDDDYIHLSLGGIYSW